MEILVQPGFRVIRGPDWCYKNQDGGKGHAGGTVLGHRGVHQPNPNFPKQSVQVQWDNGDKGLYRVGNDQAFDLRIIDTANAVCHPKIWCDGCNADEIKGMRWRCTECYAIDLCTTCYMNDEHDLSHVFMRVLTSHKTSMGPKMLPRSSSSRIALKGIFPGGKVVRYPQWYKRIGSDTQLGKIVKNGQTAEDRVKVQAVVEFICTPERVDFTKISCTLPGSGGHVYEGHLPNLGDPEPVSEGDKVLVTATPAELEKLHKRRGLWDPTIAKTFRQKGFVNERTNSGDFKVTVDDSKETFTMNSSALKKLHPLCLGQLVRISNDIEMVKRLQFGHGGWTAAMKKAISKVGQVVQIDGSDIHVRMEDNHKFIFALANLTPAKILVSAPEDDNMEETSREYTRIMQEPEKELTVAAAAGDFDAVERILAIHPEWIHYEPSPGRTLLGYITVNGSTDMIKYLVEKGAFVESIDNNGWTPLIHATHFNKFETVRYLLEQGADVNAVTHQGFTSLSTACSKGFFECAHYLLMHGADMNLKGEEGVTPVLLSTDSGRRTIVDLIVDRKESDLKTVSKTLVSVMHGAAQTSNTYGITKLLDKVPRLVEATEDKGRTPLFYAVSSGEINAAECLIKKGHCSVNTVEDEMGLSPLGVALSQGQLHLVDILVKNGADINLPNHYCTTSLQMALNVIHVHIVRSQNLKEELFMAEMKKKWGHLGIKTNTDALLAFLVYHGGDLNARSSMGITIREQLQMTKDPILPSLVEIQTRKGKDIAIQESIANRPLRNLTKKSPGPEPEANPVVSLLKKSTSRTGSKKQSAEISSGLSSGSGRKLKSSGKESGHDQQNAAGDITVRDSKEKASGQLHQLQAQLQRKNDELETLRSRVQTLEHLVKKKISFACGHDVIRSIAELIPECPNCSEPITSVVDLQ